MTSHKKLILAHLRRGKSLTKAQALKMFGCWNTGARICELRQEGHDIITTMISRTNRHGDDVSFAEYSLLQ